MALQGRLYGQRSLIALVVVLIALAWLSLGVWGQSPYARFLNHQTLDQLQATRLLLLVYVGGWVLMVVAMMLPTSLPLVLLFRALVQRRSNSWRLVCLLLVGYLSVWTLFGLAIHVGDSFIHAAVDASPWLQQHTSLIGAITLIVAGAYQFTPLKYVCLDKCRAPMSFITGHWHGRREHGQAFALGVHHGIFCVGCCWSLMLLMFAVGVGSLAWMLGLGAVMAIEKNVGWGRHVGRPLGALLVLWGVAVAVAAAPGAAI